MRAISLFSGIEGFGLGLEQADLQVVAQVEIDQACRNNVLARHFPDVPRWADITELDPHDLPAADLVCGGFPCQDISVAGRRAGLAGARSGLWWEFRRILAAVRPRWVAIENVPGLLSSNDGRDMGAILGALGDLGYMGASRVLDAQHFGLAQRRRRVFIVGCLGDRRAPVQVLLEPEGRTGHPAPRRTAGQGAAASLTAGVAAARGVNAPGRRAEDDVNLVAYSVAIRGRDGGAQAELGEEGVAKLRAGDGGSSRQPLVLAHALTAEGADALEDGMGRGTPLVVANALTAGHHGRGPGRYDDSETFVTAVSESGPGWWRDGIGPLRVEGERPSFPTKLALEGTAVRRLTPTECERLQGFPDGWTAGQPDSVRYRQLGNAVAVPVAEWIGRRILESA